MLNYFELIKIFCVVVKATSFRQAAIELAKSPQAVTRAIQQLEQLKGQTLFYRSTRHHKVTKEGEALFIQAQPLLTNFEQLIANKDHELGQNVSGEIRLTMPTAFGKSVVLPILEQFMQKYPDVTINCLMTDDHVDVIEKQIDIGMRTGFLNDNRYVSRKIKNIHFFLVAAPNLIQTWGEPQHIDDLNQLPLAVLNNLSQNQFWGWGFENAQTYLPQSAYFSTNDLDTYAQALVSGIGFGHLPDFIAMPLINANQLVHVMQPIQSTPWSLYIYRPQLGPTSPKIRLLYDFLADHFIHQLDE